ncbi:hypothetical protein KSF_014170 [Reticulibacter mediterranei]|uniref:Uncharacterized protein n=1 Tax=Reticulibacter mediterranei TaxID=2778369 RepID=A0A8J3IHF7_9CHLR|nr:hypothetical protein [Reticulibacter mediterranei]GHO91369.1 hypothetical protein KSF_014170 [Reticulibacter mediterranei]
MAQVTMGVDLSTLVNALLEGNIDAIIAAAREHLQREEQVDVLIGRLGLIAVQGDPDGHPSITLAAAAMLSRLLHTIPAPIDTDKHSAELALPLLVQALLSAIPAIRAGHQAQSQYPDPLFPSELPEGKTVNEMMHQAVYKNDALLAERLLFGLYGSGADYRTTEVRAYEGIATTFQNAGHPLMLAVRGFQLLDAVEWGNRAPNILHWLAPHLPLRPDSDEPAWVRSVREYTGDQAHSVVSIRTRLSTPKNASALSLRQLIISDADTTKVCQGVYDALIKGEASPQAVGAVIALAAADILEYVPDTDRALFVRVAHGLLFSAAVRQVFQRVQDVEALNLLFTSAAFVNALHKEVIGNGAQRQPVPASKGASSTAIAGGGLIAAAQLETVASQLKAQDLGGALATAQRYFRLGHDPRALFATIALVASSIDSVDDQGHTLQIVQAAAEEYISWSQHRLPETNIEGLLLVALRAAAFGKRDTIVSQL